MTVYYIQMYKDIILEAHIADGGKVSKLEANYTDHAVGQDECHRCKNFMSPSSCYIVEGIINPEGWCKYYEHSQLSEKWGTETKVSPSERGKYHGKTKAELIKSYNNLKKSGPHKRGSPEFGHMRELAFAIRAKGGWGDVGEE